MVYDKIRTEIKLLGKSEEEKLKIMRVTETKEHLNQAYEECKDIIQKSKLSGIKCICDKIQNRKWIDKDNIRLGKKLYGM